jgi:hypothetical protein
MTRDEMDQKLRAIDRLKAVEDVDGWRRAITPGDPWYMRPPFDGEIAALLRRKQQLLRG